MVTIIILISRSDMLLAPTFGARNLLKHKAKEDTKKAEEKGEIKSVSAKDLLRITHKKVQTHNLLVSLCVGNILLIKEKY